MLATRNLAGRRIGRLAVDSAACSLILTGDVLQAMRYAVAEMVAMRRVRGLPIHKAVLEAHYLLTASVSGSENSDESEELEPGDLIGTKAAAEILGCSTRWVRAIAADLDGQWCGRQWVFRRRRVVEYAEAKGVAGGGDRCVDGGGGAVPPRVT